MYCIWIEGWVYESYMDLNPTPDNVHIDLKPEAICNEYASFLSKEDRDKIIDQYPNSSIRTWEQEEKPEGPFLPPWIDN